MNTVAVQLYSVRELLQQDFEGTIRRLAEMGYRSVETANIYGESPQHARALLDELGIRVCAAHINFPLSDSLNKVIDTLGILGCEMLVCPSLRPYFQDMDGIQRACDVLNETHAAIQSAGLSLAYHNHDFEFQTIAGQYGLLHLLDSLDESIMLEVDVYWLQVAGVDVLELLDSLNERVNLLHLKDGSGSKDAAMTALGTGVMDIPSVIARSRAAWHIVEIDRCDTDMMTALQQSYHYLEGLNE